MRLNHNIVPALMLLALLMPLSAGAADLQMIVLRLQDRYNTVTTVTADFTQEVYSRGFGTSQISAGRAYFKRPGKMRWVYVAPVRDELISNGKKVWFYQPDLRQVLERNVGPGGNLASDFLSGVVNLRKDFTVKLAEEGDHTYTLDLTPTIVQPGARKILLEIDRLDMVVLKTTVEDFMGNTTTVSFSNIEFNTGVGDAIFEFTPPPGASIIRQ